MNFEKTLYKRDSKGATREWRIEVDGDKYRVVSGQHNGKKTTSKWTVCEGKNIGKSNETTPEEQALSEAQSKAKKKSERGYTEDLNAIDDVKVYKPMLAQNFEKQEKYIMDKDLALQVKLDGIRCLWTDEGPKTRTGKDILSLTEDLKKEALRLQDLLGKDIKFVDGELYNHDINFEDIVSAVRKEYVSELSDQIKYCVYDFNGEGTFKEKFEKLSRCFKFGQFSHLVLVDTSFVSDDKQAAISSYEKEALADNYEGIMVRNANSDYAEKRTKDLLKYKRFIDEEFDIVDIHEGVGNRSGMVGSFELRTKDGKPFNANPTGTNEWKEEVLKNKESIIGKQATIRYFELTAEGIPRFGVVHSIRDYE